MSNTDAIMNYPYGQFLMIRLDFVLLRDDELQARILRIIESKMLEQKKQWQDEVVKAIENKETPPPEPEHYWVSLSYAQFIARLYKFNTAKSPEGKHNTIGKGTLRKAIQALIEDHYLLIQPQPGNEFDSAQYTINTSLVEKHMWERLPKEPWKYLGYNGNVEVPPVTKNVTPPQLQNLTLPPVTKNVTGDIQNLDLPLTNFDTGELQNLKLLIDKVIDSRNRDGSKEDTSSVDVRTNATNDSAIAPSHAPSSPQELSTNLEQLSTPDVDKGASDDDNHTHSHTDDNHAHYGTRTSSTEKLRDDNSGATTGYPSSTSRDSSFSRLPVAEDVSVANNATDPCSTTPPLEQASTDIRIAQEETTHTEGANDAHNNRPVDGSLDSLDNLGRHSSVSGQKTETGVVDHHGSDGALLPPRAPHSSRPEADLDSTKPDKPNGNVTQSPEQPSNATKEVSQPSLIEKPAKPEMPPASMKWCAEKMVQITEFELGKYYPESRRGKQKDAAQKIMKLDAQVTEQQYIDGYRKLKKWWNDHKGPLHVTHMAEKTKRGETRVLEQIDELEFFQQKTSDEARNSHPAKTDRSNARNTNRVVVDNSPEAVADRDARNDAAIAKARARLAKMQAAQQAG
jgi:hypothetical protein